MTGDAHDSENTISRGSPHSTAATPCEWMADPEVLAFVARRLCDKAGDRGLSSDAMIGIALATSRGIPEGYDGPVPLDSDDLSRCCEAFKLAPWKLRQRMLPILAKWSAELEVKRQEREARSAVA